MRIKPHLYSLPNLEELSFHKYCERQHDVDDASTAHDEPEVWIQSGGEGASEGRKGEWRGERCPLVRE